LGHGVPARQVLALTFTNKAAEEMQARLAKLAPGQAVWIGTFHRFCARLLRQHARLVGLDANYTIYDTSDSAAVLRRVLEETGSPPGHFTIQHIGNAISWAKNKAIGPEQYEPRPGYPLGSVVAEVYPAYQARLLASNAADFDDLLLHVAELLRHNPGIRSALDARYRYILVDEYQDTNLAQYAIVRALSIDYPNLSVTGDPDQSIYGWRGASLGNLAEFEGSFPQARVVKLEQNYRSTKRILRVADQLIARNMRRRHKELYTDNPEGPPVRLIAYPSSRDEAEDIAWRIAELVQSGQRRAGDIAVFYRVNALSRALEFALRARGIAFQMVRGVEFYQRKEIKDVVAYLTLINNPRDDVALGRVVNTPLRGIGRSTIERLRDHASRRGLTLLDAARQSGLVEGLTKRAAVAVARFVALYDRLSLVAARPVEEILGHVLAETNYRGQFQGGTEEDDQRLANIEELLTAAREFDEQSPGEGRLEEFLEQVCLVSDTDDWQSTTDRVTLMTLHASKGLEFPVVFLIGLEEKLIPHDRSEDKPEQLEEERRLLFVGITRARQELQLSLARYRDFRGKRGLSVPSRFLMELPLAEMEATTATWSEAVQSQTDHADDRQAAQDHAQHDADDRGEEWSDPQRSGLDSDDRHARHADSKQPAAALAERPVFANLTTAAQLAAGSEPQPTADPDAFQQGMPVLHPEYGVGRIVALSGGRTRRIATVDFASGAGRRTFVLEVSPLRPLASGQG
ncbi:MAG: 3'-5' exonuclease, partial [Pirellulales bacterium]